MRRGPEHDRLLQQSSNQYSCEDEEATISEESKKPPLPPPSIREVLHRQSVLNLVCYTLLALHNISFDQLIPIFMHYPPQKHTRSNPEYQPPFQFSGGFGLDSASIGLMFTLWGATGMISQFFLFPPIARKYGVVRCLRATSIIMPIVYLLVPFTALLPTQRSQMAVMFALMVVKGCCSTFAFPSSTILLTNSASSLRILGTLNGLATSLGALGRAAGPAIIGSMFTYGVDQGYVIAPWWLMSAIAFAAAVPVFFVVEGEGFGGDDGEVEDSDEDEDDDEARQLQNKSRVSATIADTGNVVAEDEEEEEGYGSVAPLFQSLSRTTTRSSQAIDEDSDNDEETTTPTVRSRQGSRITTRHRRVSRRTSIPFGMGDQGISRKYSSNLGQSLGSAGSYGGRIT